MRIRGLLVAVLVVLGVLGMGGIALAAPSAPAVDSEGASAVGPFGGTLEAQVNPGEQETTCLRFEYGTSTAYGSSVPCANGSLGSGSEDTPASAAVAGLKPGTEYHFRVVVENPSSPPLVGTVGPDQTFTTPLVIGGAASFSGVSDTGATLSAPVDPGGVATTYYFEYGSTAAYGSRTPAVTSYADEQVDVTVQLTGLTPVGEYHFRVVTESEGAVREEGADMVFRTLPVGIAGLPDGRVFEMVSSMDNEGANVYVPYASGNSPDDLGGVPTDRPFEVSMNGDAVAYIADATTGEDGVGQGGAGLGNQYVARRSTAGGWTQESIQPPAYIGTFYQAFTSDLSTGFLGLCGKTCGQSSTLTSQAPGGGYDLLYSRDLGGGAYRSLITTTPPNRPAKRGFGFFGVNDDGQRTISPVFAGASGDLGQELFEANDALVPGEGGLERELQADVKREVEEGEDNVYLYDSMGGRLSLVDVLPDGRVEPDATFGGPPIGTPRSNPPVFDHAISEDGRYIYWTAQSTGMLYMREDGVRTIPVSAGAAPAQFWTATGDGVYAFYTEGEHLYRFDVNHPEAPTVLAGTGAGVEGVIGASENGEDVYFVASGELAEGAVAGQPNLYLAHVGGAVTFIATLSPEDGTGVEPYGSLYEYILGSGDGEVGDWHGGLGQRTAEVTSDGESVLFMSNRALKAQGLPAGYANDGQDEVYVYDAGLGKLFCASCSQSGEPGSSGYLPISWNDTYIPQWISEDGSRVFFNSPSPLVSQDTDGVQDVYEWEREGSGSCTTGSGVDGGCVYLLSGGTSSAESWLAGASANGSDAFIITRAELTGQSTNGTFDLFDARVGGVPAAAPAGCSGVDCPSGPGATPGFAAPPSVAYNGAGNITPPTVTGKAVKPKAKVLTRAQKLVVALRACRREPRRARGSCEARARKRYGPVGRSGASRSAKKGRK